MKNDKQKIEFDWCSNGDWRRVSLSGRVGRGRWTWLGTFSIRRPHTISAEMKSAMKKFREQHQI